MGDGSHESYGKGLVIWRVDRLLNPGDTQWLHRDRSPFQAPFLQKAQDYPEPFYFTSGKGARV